MKTFAAFLAIALCSSGILVNGGILQGVGDAVGDVGNGLGNVVEDVVDGVSDTVNNTVGGVGDVVGDVTDDLGNAVGGVVGGVGDTVGNVVNDALNLVQSLLQNLVKILSGLLTQLPHLDVNANVGLDNLKIALGDARIVLLEDNDILDLKVDNVTIAISNLDIEADITITNLNVPELINNGSITDKISIKITELSVTATVEVSLGVKPVISDIINLRVNVQAAIAIAANINTDILKLALGTNLPLTVDLAVGNFAQQNKQALISILNSKF